MSSKYAALPDLDTTQDIYETPDLDSTLSTVPTTVSAASSDAGSDRSIDASHLRPSDARHNFEPTIASKRRAHRRRRGSYDSADEDGEYGTEPETIEQRLARLQREVEELRHEARLREEERLESGQVDESSGAGESVREEGQEEGQPPAEMGDVMLGIEEVAEALEALTVVDRDERGAHARLARKLAAGMPAPAVAAGKKGDVVDGEAEHADAAQDPSAPASFTVTYAPSFRKSHTLGMVADFDARLTVLEKVLGMSSSALTNLDASLPTHAMIPTINTLNKQISMLTSATTSSLDAASRRVKVLVSEAEKLTEARKAAAAAAKDTPPNDLEADETVNKINALYGTLPVIEGTKEMLPAVLERLRSLRAIHQDAARASEALTGIEKRQIETEVEVERWEKALEKVEGVMRESEGTIKSNMDHVEGWVKELEDKMQKVEKLHSG